MGTGLDIGKQLGCQLNLASPVLAGPVLAGPMRRCQVQPGWSIANGNRSDRSTNSSIR
jgi:hypothetical protein